MVLGSIFLMVCWEVEPMMLATLVTGFFGIEFL